MTVKGKSKTTRAPRKITARQRERTAREIGKKLVEARRAAGLTQAAAARSVRMSPALVSKIERGARSLDPLELARFARLYGKSIVDFIS